MRASLSESLWWAMRFDCSYFRLIAPIRLALPILIMLTLGELTNHVSLGVSAAIGSFICGVSDTGEALPIRARVMTVTSVALGLTALIGALVSENVDVIVIVSIPVALVCGYVAVFGPNATVTGMLSLVIFDLFAGGPVSLGFSFQESFAVVVGGLLQTGFALADWPLRRMSGIRGQVADVWRAYAVMLAGKPRDVMNPRLPGQLVHVATTVEFSGALGGSREWLRLMVTSAERIRMPVASIEATRKMLEDNDGNPAEREALIDFCLATSRFSRTVARAMVLPWRRRAVAARFLEVQRSAERAREYAPLQVDTVVNALETAARGLATPPPIGRRRGQMRFALQTDELDYPRLIKEDLRWSSPIARHAVRLAAVTPIAWIVGMGALDDHQYWVPLTVAWVTRPGYGVTMGRVISRTIGTLIGLVFIAGVMYVLHPGTWGMIAIATIAAYILFAALPVNYAIAVVFITSLILTMLALSGDDLVASLEARAIGTILGGMLSLIASQVGASWAAPKLAKHLSIVVAHTRTYIDCILNRTGDVRVAATSLINARLQCQSAIEDAMLEPKHGPIPARRAERVLDALLTGMFVIAAADPDSRAASSERGDAPAIDQDLAALQGKLEAIHNGEVTIRPLESIPPANPPDSSTDPARTAFQRASALL